MQLNSGISFLLAESRWSSRSQASEGFKSVQVLLSVRGVIDKCSQAKEGSFVNALF